MIERVHWGKLRIDLVRYIRWSGQLPQIAESRDTGRAADERTKSAAYGTVTIL